jgi:hypothetical protein
MRAQPQAPAKGGRYLVGFGGPQGPAALGSTDLETTAIARATNIAKVIGPVGFGTVIDRFKGTAWQWKMSTDGTINRQGIKLPDGVTGVLLGASLGGDLPENEARRRLIAAIMRKHGGDASVMGIPLSVVLAPRYCVCLHFPGGAVPICCSRKSLPAVTLARQIAQGAAGSKMFTLVVDRRSKQGWMFKPDAKGHVIASGSGLPPITSTSLVGSLGEAAAAGATGGAAAGAAAVAMTALINLISRAFATKKPADARVAASYAEKTGKPKTAESLHRTAEKFESQANDSEASDSSTTGWDSATTRTHTVPQAKLEAFLHTQKHCNGFGIMSYGQLGDVFEIRWEPMTPTPALPSEVVAGSRSYPIIILPTYRAVAYSTTRPLDDIKTER